MKNMLQQCVGPVINYLCNATKVAQGKAPSSNLSSPAMDNGVRVGRSNLLSVTLWHTPHGIYFYPLYFPNIINNKFFFQFY